MKLCSRLSMTQSAAPSAPEHDQPETVPPISRSVGETLETILVVDDFDLVLKVVVAILKAARFHVLQADCSAAALALAHGYEGRIDLLLADVQMPNMTGPDLGEELKRFRPDMHVMLMSGFEGGDLLVLNYGWAYIQKPFVSKKLVQMVNTVLHTPDRSQGTREFDTSKK